MHLTEASSLWLQLWMFWPGWRQSTNLVSFPKHPTSSNRIGCEESPGPKVLRDNASAPRFYGDEWMFSTKKWNLHSKRTNSTGTQLPSVGAPSCLHTTAASTESQLSSQTVDQIKFELSTSTLPSRTFLPLTNLISPTKVPSWNP